MTTHRTGSSGTFSADLKLAGKQVLQSGVIHDQHDQVNPFHADLQTPAAATYRNKSGSAPASAGTARGYPASVLATKNKAAFYQVRYDDDALGIFQHFFRNTFVRGRHNFIQNYTRVAESCSRVLLRVTGPRNTGEYCCQAQQQNQNPLHVFSSLILI